MRSTSSILIVALATTTTTLTNTFAFSIQHQQRSSSSSSFIVTSHHRQTLGNFFRPLFSVATDDITTLDGDTIRGPVTPLTNFVWVRTKDVLTATDGGILLPDQSKERPSEGEVICAGPGMIHPHTGIRIPNPVSAGTSVLFGKFDGITVKYNDEDVQIIRDSDIMLYYTEGVKMTIGNVTPCRDYVLVKLEGENLKTSSGIVIAASATRDNVPCEGRVVKVGEGRLCSRGTLTPCPVEVGERVKFKDYAGNEVRIDGEEYALVRMVDILCSIKE